MPATPLDDRGKQRIAGAIMVMIGAPLTAWLWMNGMNGEYALGVPRRVGFGLMVFPFFSVLGLGALLFPMGPEVPRRMQHMGRPNVHPRDLPWKWWVVIVLGVAASISVRLSVKTH